VTVVHIPGGLDVDVTATLLPVNGLLSQQLTIYQGRNKMRATSTKEENYMFAIMLE
jgi:hypothetical protein